MKAVYLGSEPMDIPIKEDVFVIPSNELPKFEKWLEIHDKQVRTEVISEISREMRLLYGNEYESKIRAEVIDELVRPLQNRCFALTQGQMCFFCPMECEHRKTKFRNDEQLKEQNK